MRIRVIGIMLDLLGISWLQVIKARWLDDHGSACVGAVAWRALHRCLSVRNVRLGGHRGYL